MRKIEVYLHVLRVIRRMVRRRRRMERGRDRVSPRGRL
jgi:hypothetical protein